jgi:hypothetical protein
MLVPLPAFLQGRSASFVGGILVTIAVGASVAALSSSVAPVDAPARGVSSLLGDPLPDARVIRLDGSRFDLHAALSGGPTIVAIIGTKDCTSCMNYPLEFRILHGKFPALRTLIVGTGAEPDSFRSYFHEAHVEGIGIIDSQGDLVRGLGITTTPVTIVADSGGRVLYVDTRPAWEAAQFPIGRLLQNLSVSFAVPQ